MKAVIVLGMHRSGTSVLTQVIHKMGYQTGEVSPPTDAQNPDGYFEDFDVVRFNDRMLRALGSEWDAPQDLEIQRKHLERFKEEAVRLIQTNYADQDKWVLKDPRMCLTLDFWQHVIPQAFPGIELSAVHIIRHPVEVAQSQKKRAEDEADFHIMGKDIRYFLLLWYHYTQSVLRLCNIDKNYMVTYSELLSNPRATVEGVARFLEIDDPAAILAASKSIKRSLHRQSAQAYLHETHPEFEFIESFYNHLATTLANRDFQPSHMRNIYHEQANMQLCLSLQDTFEMLFTAGAAARKQWLQLQLYKQEVHPQIQEVEDLRRALADIKSSPSWRITAPLRQMKAWVKGIRS